ncbi:choice-of-anchor A family protein [Terrisporobacter sp.]
MRNSFKAILNKVSMILLVTLLFITQLLGDIYASQKQVQDFFNNTIEQEITVENNSDGKIVGYNNQSNNKKIIENQNIILDTQINKKNINQKSNHITITIELIFKLNNLIDKKVKDNYYVALFDEYNNCVSKVKKLDVSDGKASAIYSNEENENLSYRKYNVHILELQPGRSYNSRYDQNDYKILKSGNVLSNIYKIQNYNSIELSESNKSQVVSIYAEANGEELTLNILNNLLGISKNFGVFTNKFTQSADIESNIAANVANIRSDYNFSENNINLVNNKIIVTKTYRYKNDSPVKNEPVIFKLYKDTGDNRELKDEIQTITDENGKVIVKFEDLKDGIYSVSEVVNGEEVEDSSSNIEISDNENIDVIFENNKYIDLNSNYSYINNVESLGNPRHDSIIVLGKKSYEENKNYNDRNVNIFEAGTNGFDIIDFSKELQKLSLLSKIVSTALPSDSLKVMYLDYTDLTDRLNIEYEGKYVLVNVDMSKAPDYYRWPGQYKINGQQVSGGWNENDIKILWNFYNYAENNTYNGTITTGGTTSGIILAPNAKVNSASGNHIGTIIANEIDHTTGEIHFIKYGTWKEQNVKVTSIKTNNEEEQVKEVGKLTVKKELGKNTEMSEEEEFVIKVTGKFSDTEDKEKEIKINKLDIGKEKELSGVIYGETYIISENEIEDYKAEIDNSEITMKDTNQTVTVTNTKKEVGKLTVKKELGKDTEMTEEEKFIIKVTGKFTDTNKTEREIVISKADIGKEKEVSGVIYGETYKISEEKLEDYEVEIDNSEVSMNYKDQTVTVTNTKKEDEVTPEEPPVEDDSTSGDGSDDGNMEVKPDDTVSGDGSDEDNMEVKPDDTVSGDGSDEDNMEVKPDDTVSGDGSDEDNMGVTPEEPPVEDDSTSGDGNDDEENDKDKNIVETGDSYIYTYVNIILVATIIILITNFNENNKKRNSYKRR